MYGYFPYFAIAADDSFVCANVDTEEKPVKKRQAVKIVKQGSGQC
jgi:hypothetical protein